MSQQEVPPPSAPPHYGNSGQQYTGVPQYAGGGQYPPPYGQGQYLPLPQDPGKGIGIAGFVLSFFGPLAIIGLIMSIVGRNQSKKAGLTNGLAIAGIVISIVVLLGTIAVGVTAANVIQKCEELGPGVHHVGAVTYTCG